MNARLSSDAAAAICSHMNEDHADAIAAYARVYGNIAGVTAAEMLAIDDHAMELRVQTVSDTVVTRIAFDHVLQDAVDARTTLIAMAQHATS